MFSKKPPSRTGDRGSEILHEIAEASPALLFQIRRSSAGRMQVSYVSRATETLFGVHSQDPEQDYKTFLSLLHDGDAERIGQGLANSMADLQARDMEFRIRRPEGAASLWVKAVVTPRRDEAGEMVWNGVLVDISAQKQAEYLLREMTQHLPGVVFQQRLEPDGRIWYPFLSGALMDLPNDIDALRKDARGLIEHIHVDDREMVTQAVADSAREMTPYRIEYRIRVAKDEMVWLRTEAQPLRAEDGAVVWNGFSVNINREKEAETRVSEVTQSLPGVVFQLRMTDGPGMAYTYVTDRSESLLGLTPSQIMANASVLHDRVQLSDLVRLTKAFTEALKSGQTTAVECRYNHPDGRQRWLRITATPHLTTEGASLWSGHTMDITAEREAQQRLAQVTETMPGAVFQLVPNAKNRLEVSFVSQGIEQLVGIPREEVLKNENPLNDVIIEEDRPIMTRTLRDSLRAKTAGVCDVRVTHQKTGRRIWIRAAASPNTENPQRITWSGFWWDITDIKELQSQLARAREAAEAATRIKSEFLANMSHEIRTPMNAILGLSHLALRADPPKRLEAHLQKIDRASRSLLGVINGILDFSRIEAGRLVLESTVFSLDTVLEDLTNLVGPGAHDKGLEFSCRADADVPRNLIGDPLRLGQILLNLASNAIKFTDKGRIGVRAERVRVNPGRVTLLFTVEDTGIGLNDEQKSRLFSAFAQADTSTTRKYGGSGLGLSISKSLVEMMKGSIDVDSTAGRGSRFFFTAEFGLSSADAPDPQRAFTGGRPLEGLRILVAEDNAINQEIAREILEAAGARVVTVGDGAAAVQAVKVERYDAVVMDVNMPVLNGLEATREIRRHSGQSELPIVAMTASAMADDRARCLAAGMNAHIGKPIDVEDLIATLSRLTRGQVSRSPSSVDATPPADLMALAAQLDLVAAIRRVNHNGALYRRLLHTFADGNRDWTAQAQEALQQKNPKLLEKHAHALKGTAANLGATRLADAAQQLERAAHRQDDALAEHIQAVDRPLQDLLNALTAIEAATPAAVRTPEPLQLRQLNRLLAHNDAKATDLAQSLAQQFPDESGFARLHKQAAAYDFETARITLLKLSARLKIPL